MAIRGAYAAGEARGFSEQLLKGIETRELQTQKYEDLMIDSAKAKAPKYAAAQTAYKNTVTKAKQLKTDFGFTDTEIVGIASKYDINAIYDSMFALQAQAKANNSTLGFDKSSILGTLNLPSSSLLPKGMSMEQALRQIAFNTQENLDASDNPKSEVSRRSAFGKALGQMFSFNPRARAEDLVSGMEIAGFSAAEINAWSPEAGKGDMFPDVASSPLAMPEQDYKATDLQTVTSRTLRDFGKQFGLLDDLENITPLNEVMEKGFLEIDSTKAAQATAGLLIDQASGAMARIDRNLAFKGYGMGFGNAGSRTDTRNKIRQMIDTPAELQQFIQAEKSGAIIKLILENDGDFTEGQLEAVLAGEDPNAITTDTVSDATSDATSLVLDSEAAAIAEAITPETGGDTGTGSIQPAVANGGTVDNILNNLSQDQAAVGETGESVDAVTATVPDRSAMEARFQKWVAPLMTPAVNQGLVSEVGMDRIPKDDSWKNSSYLLPEDAEKLSKSVIAGEVTGDFLQEVWDRGNTDFGVAIDIGNAGLAYGLASVIDFGRGVLGADSDSTSGDWSNSLKDAGAFYSQRASDIATMGWKDYVEAQTEVEVPEAVLAEVKSGFDTEVFTASGVNTKDGKLSYEAFAGFVPDFPGDVPPSLRTQQTGTSLPSKVMSTVESLMAPTRGLMEMEMPSSEELQAAITERTGQIPKDYKRQIVTSINSFNETLKDFEASVNVFVPNAIDAVSSATLSGVDNINDRLKALETLVNETMDAEVDKRVPAFKELQRQFGELTLFPSKKEGTIDTGPNTITDTQFDTDAAVLEFFSPERNAVRKRIIQDLLGIETEGTTPLPEPEVSPSIMSKPVDTSKRTGTVSKPTTSMTQDPAIEVEALVAEVEDKFWIKPKDAVTNTYESIFLKALVQDRKKPLSFKTEKAAEAWVKKNFPDNKLKSSEARNLIITLAARFPSK
mgnify:CR=1 FL=1